MKFRSSRKFAQTMDDNDPLREQRVRFHLPAGTKRHESIYLCGHSLGLQPRLARDRVNAELDYWQDLGVKGHFEAPTPWKYYHLAVRDSMAKLVGALPSEVVVMNSLTVNLHLMMVSFYRPEAGRSKILIESQAFPSDRYAMASQIDFHGFDPSQNLIEVPSKNGETGVSTQAILDVLEQQGDQIALILLGGVNYLSGHYLDIRAITRLAQQKGCVVGIDLAHAAGNLVLNLHDWNVDFAVWCTYKYLNGGPGNLGACFVHQRHERASVPRFAGWWGHDPVSRFKMPAEFMPTTGADGWQLSNPPILPLAALRASLDIFDDVGMDALRVKSKVLTAYLEYLLVQLKSPRIRQLTPSDPAQRGCQLSFEIAGADRSLYDYLLAQDVIGDWREPNVMRLAPVPLYNSFMDVYEAVDLLKKGLKS